MAEWSKSTGIALDCNQPISLNMTGYVERINMIHHIEVLECYRLDSLQKVKNMTAG
jgi:hypothetical protein